MANVSITVSKNVRKSLADNNTTQSNPIISEQLWNAIGNQPRINALSTSMGHPIANSTMRTIESLP